MLTQGLTVCVNYADLLELTLLPAVLQLDKLVVVTTPEDEATRHCIEELDETHPELSHRVVVHKTRVFYANGANFNKGAAIEEAMLAHFRNDRWSLIFDADTIIPDMSKWFPELENHRSTLIGVKRKQVIDIGNYRADGQSLEQFLVGKGYEIISDGEPAGYFQLFHPTSLHLIQRPWYGTDWKHAGGCDTDFCDKFQGDWKWMEGFYAYHIGEFGRNWHGRTTPMLGGMKCVGPVSPVKASKLMREMRANRARNKGPYLPEEKL